MSTADDLTERAASPAAALQEPAFEESDGRAERERVADPAAEMCNERPPSCHIALADTSKYQSVGRRPSFQSVGLQHNTAKHGQVPLSDQASSFSTQIHCTVPAARLDSKQDQAPPSCRSAYLQFSSNSMAIYILLTMNGVSVPEPVAEQKHQLQCGKKAEPAAAQAILHWQQAAFALLRFSKALSLSARPASRTHKHSHCQS